MSTEAAILFSERQHFSRWWLLLVAASAAAVIIPVLSAGKTISEALWAALIVLGLVSIIFVLPLETRITSDAISIRFFPFIWVWKSFPIEEISRMSIRKYSPIVEYGGWGVRYGFSRGWCYNTGGNMGLQIELKNKKKVLIGTQEPDKIDIVLKQVFPTTVEAGE